MYLASKLLAIVISWIAVIVVARTLVAYLDLDKWYGIFTYWQFYVAGVLFMISAKLSELAGFLKSEDFKQKE